MGRRPKPAGQGGERGSWPEPRPRPRAAAEAAAAAAAMHKRSRSAYPEQSQRDGPCVCQPYGWSQWVQDRLKSGGYWNRTCCACGVYAEGWRLRVRSCPAGEGGATQSAPVQLSAPALKQWLGNFGTISHSRVAVLQPGGLCDTSVDTVDTEPRSEGLTQHVAGCLAVPGASAAAEVKVL